MTVVDGATREDDNNEDDDVAVLPIVVWDRDKSSRSGDVLIKCGCCGCDVDFCGGVDVAACVDCAYSLSYRVGGLRKGVDTDGIGKGKLRLGRLLVDNRAVDDVGG